MQSSTLTLTVLTITLTIVASTPMSRERRGVVTDWFDNTYARISDWFTGPLENETETLLREQEQLRASGQQLIDRGRHLLDLAANLTKTVVDKVTDPANEERLKKAIESITSAGEKAVTVGQIIVKNSDDISISLRDAFQNISRIMQDSLEEVGESAKQIGHSLVEATSDLILVAKSAKDTAEVFIDTVQEAITTMELVEEASKSIRQVGQHAITLGQRLVKAGVDIGTALANAAKRIGDLSGIGK